ncbi:MAG TPA: hypothetical protein PLK34_00375 [Candidatus Pacearchaeota archaeon]|nr:hypothetical protein [Candidatus Pacearchaeota archaeon]
MADLTLFLQHELFTRFLLPFLLVSLIVFAILEKTNLLGTNKQQINALISFVIGFIFVGVAWPALMVSNLMLFLGVAVVIIFVVLLIWGSVMGKGTLEVVFGTAEKPMKWAAPILLIVILLVVAYASLWAAGVKLDEIFINPLFKQAGSEAIWVNIGFVVIIALALALVLRKTGTGSGN